MVQDYQSPVRVYKYPFELVMKAYERRFPTCELIPVFVGSDILNDSESEDGAEHVVERRCKLNVDAPYLLKKIVGVDYVFFIQKNSLNRRKRTLRITAYNESFSSRVTVRENCTYSVHPENPEWTCFEQSASLDVKSFLGFESSVEKFAMKQYSMNIAKGKEIIEHFVKQLREEGITYVPPWREKTRVPELQLPDGEDTRNHSSNNQSASTENMVLGSSATNIHTHLDKLQISEDPKFKLDSDYIQRYLGEISLLQESRLVQLRNWVAQLQKGKVPPDSMLLRFLRARDFSIEKAREMLSQSLIWRKKHQVDKTLSEYEVPQVVKDYFPGGWHYHDKEERPLYLLRLGQMDVKGLIKSVGEEGLIKLTLHVCEEGLRLCEEATRKCDKPITTWSLLVDLEGLNMRHLWSPGIKALLRIIEIVEANYPETMGHVLIIRAPRVFPILWTLVSKVIDENTRRKFLFSGGNNYQGPGGLADYMPQEYIPDFLGGPCRTLITEGGTVPKTMYMSEEDFEKDQMEQHPLYDDSVYHSVSLSRGQVHEVLIMNEDPGSVICWDFDVMRQDVVFTVFRTKVPITSKEPPVSPVGPLQTIQNINPLAADPEHKSVIEKTWREGIDYFVVETNLICHDGESIQGSHVTGYVGTYILQWRYHDQSSSHHYPLEIIDNLTTHKTKIMYFYETLKSADYKGSMSSLQSCQSGFSSLSSSTNLSHQSAPSSSCPSR